MPALESQGAAVVAAEAGHATAGSNPRIAGRAGAAALAGAAGATWLAATAGVGAVAVATAGCWAMAAAARQKSTRPKHKDNLLFMFDLLSLSHSHTPSNVPGLDTRFS
jgi:hypothetical protein